MRTLRGQLLKDCLAAAGVEAAVIERVGTYHSPSVLIDGLDVMEPGAVFTGNACRLDLPTRERVLAALAIAAGRR
jgi:hypothetical protein